MLKKKPSYNILGRELKAYYNQTMPESPQGTLMGYFDPNTFTIHLAKHINKTEELRTLYHELGHAILDRVGVSRTTTSIDSHEVIVEGLANFMIDQKKLPKKRKRLKKKSSK